MTRISLRPSRSSLALLLVCVVAECTTDGRAPAHARGTGHADPPFGFAVGLYPETARRHGWVHPPDLREVQALHANAILLTPSWSQQDVRSSVLARDAETPNDEELTSVIASAHRLGLSVALMPFVRLRETEPGVWRGTIGPGDEDRWWAGYGQMITTYAALAERSGVSLFAIGSEMTSMSSEDRAWRWRALSDRVRAITSARLAFVANHDALDLRTPMAFVDVVGVSAYFPLDGDPYAAWRAHAARLGRFAAAVGRPLMVFEVGYPSRRGALGRPWDDVAGTPVDHATQTLGYAAATAALRDAAWLDGLFFWSWYGEGGRYDRGFTPRHKPASEVASRFLCFKNALDCP